MNKVTRFISDVLFDKEINLDLFPRKNNDNFWDQFVKTGSSHYVIPALYYKLKERGFLNLLNDELVSYLEEIYNQNYKRNIELVKEVNKISHILKTNDIDHVFLKGAALVSSIYKESIGIRMIGDIDILISNNQLLKAKELITANGYKNQTKYYGLSGRHLPRLINNKKIFALELHNLLVYKNAAVVLNHYDFIKRKTVQKVNILNWKDFLFHIILNFQINDHGSLRANFSFRTLFDVFNIIKTKPETLDQLDESVHVDKIKLVMSKLQVLNYKDKSNLFLFNLRLKLKSNSSLYSNLENIVINIIISINLNFNRTVEFIKIKKYRLHVLHKLGLVK